jgi:integrase
MKLDSKTVAALKLGDKSDQIFFDAQLSGLGYRLRRGAGGKINKNWIAQYRYAGGTRRVLIGSADIINAEAARAAAKKILAVVALGGDPQAERADRRAKDALALRSVVLEYLDAKRNEVRPRTLVEATRYLSTGSYFRPLHRMPIDAVKRKDVATRLVAITRENGSVTAARARASLSAFFSWAMQMGYVEQNPVIGAVQPEDSKGRERVLSDAELIAVWRLSGDDEYGRIIRLLILLGARRAEIGGMRWSEFAADGTWTIPGERTKNHHKHTLALPAAAWDIINAVPRLTHRDQLFGVHAEKGFTDWGASKLTLDDRLLGKMSEPPWTIHDIRRTVATRMADIGIQPHIIEVVLNHHGGFRRGVAGTYNRSSYDREVPAALALWADHLMAMVEGRKSRVVPLKTA